MAEKIIIVKANKQMSSVNHKLYDLTKVEQDTNDLIELLCALLEALNTNETKVPRTVAKKIAVFNGLSVRVGGLRQLEQNVEDIKVFQNRILHAIKELYNLRKPQI